MARILVIDDDAAIVDLLRMRLEDLGHEVFAASDANGGMVLALHLTPDMITLDFKMPAGDGARVYERLRNNPRTVKTKIIFVSGMCEYDLGRSVLNDPDVRFLQKPIDIGVLKRFLSELLEGPSPEADENRFGPGEARD